MGLFYLTLQRKEKIKITSFTFANELTCTDKKLMNDLQYNFKDIIITTTFTINVKTLSNLTGVLLVRICFNLIFIPNNNTGKEKSSIELEVETIMRDETLYTEVSQRRTTKK